MSTEIIFGTVELENGETLFYRQQGRGEKTLLLIHGNMSSSEHWTPVLERLPETYTAYALDLRGMGKSTYHHPFNSLNELAQDVRDFIERKKIGPLVVVGWSTGGGVAMELAIEYPQLVEQVVLVETVSYKGYPIFKRDEQGTVLPGEFYDSKEAMAKDPVQVVPALLAIENKEEAVMRQIWDHAIYVHQKPEEKDYQRFLEATFEQRNLVDIDWALASFNLSNEHNGVVAGNGKIDRLTQPVLAFWGDTDLVVTEPMVRETVAAIGENAALVVLEKCGHSPLVDCPDLLVEKILAFVESR